jgi:hypothetical protein
VGNVAFCCAGVPLKDALQAASCHLGITSGEPSHQTLDRQILSNVITNPHLQDPSAPLVSAALHALLAILTVITITVAHKAKPMLPIMYHIQASSIRIHTFQYRVARPSIAGQK